MQFNVNGFSYLFGHKQGEYETGFHSLNSDVQEYTSNFFEMTDELDNFFQSDEGKALEEFVTQNVEKLYSELCNSIMSIRMAEEQEAMKPSRSEMFSSNWGPQKGQRRGRHNRHNELNEAISPFEDKWREKKFPEHRQNFGNKGIEIEKINTPKIEINNKTENKETTSVHTTKEENTSSAFNINEKIENFEQGIIGDCWLLSGLNSLSNSKKGQELINNAISKNEDGSYTVTFAGVNKNVNVTEKDLLTARESGLYSTGDDDALLMEVAFEKIIDKVQNGEIKISGDTTSLSFIEADEGQISSLDGGWLSDMIYLLTGDDPEFITTKASITEFLDKMETNPQDYVAKLSFPSASKGETEDFNSITDINGNEIYSLGSGGHAFAIKSVSNGVVTIVNPYDTSKEHQISYDELIYSARNIEYYKL